VLVNSASQPDRSVTRRWSRPAVIAARSVCLPGGVPFPPRMRASLAGRIEGTLGGVETVTGGVERAFG